MEKPLTNVLKVGIYTVEIETIGRTVTVSFKNPGGSVVARGLATSVNAAAQNAADATQDEGVKLVVNQKLFAEL